MRTVSSTSLNLLSEVTAQDSQGSPFAEKSPAHSDFDHNTLSESNSSRHKFHQQDSLSGGKHRNRHRGIHKSCRGKKTSVKNTSESLLLLPRLLGSPQYSTGAILVLVGALSIVITLLTIQSINIANASLSNESHHTSANSFLRKFEKESKDKNENAKHLYDDKNDDQQRITGSDSSQRSDSNDIASSLPQELSSSGNGVSGQTPSVPQSSIPQSPTSPLSGVNINSASLEELQEIPGVGPALARRIIDYRTVHGQFTSIEDLLSVSGIGAKKFEKMRNHVRIQ